MKVSCCVYALNPAFTRTGTWLLAKVVRSFVSSYAHARAVWMNRLSPGNSLVRSINQWLAIRDRRSYTLQRLWLIATTDDKRLYGALLLRRSSMDSHALWCFGCYSRVECFSIFNPNNRILLFDYTLVINHFHP